MTDQVELSEQPSPKSADSSTEYNPSSSRLQTPVRGHTPSSPRSLSQKYPLTLSPATLYSGEQHVGHTDAYRLQSPLNPPPAFKYVPPRIHTEVSNRLIIWQQESLIPQYPQVLSINSVVIELLRCKHKGKGFKNLINFTSEFVKQNCE